MKHKLKLAFSLYIFIIIILAALFITLFFGQKTGSAAYNNGFVEEFNNNMGSAWAGNPKGYSQVFEEYWNRTFSVAELDSPLSVKLSETQVSEDKGSLRLRLKLGSIASGEFIPLMRIGDLILYIGDCSASNQLKAGSSICTAAIDKGSTEIASPHTTTGDVEAGEWREIILDWKKGSNPECPSGQDMLLSIFIDNYKDYTYLNLLCSEDLLFTVSHDTITILPSLSSLGDFSIDPSISSIGGFSIESLIAGQDIMQELKDSSITKKKAAYFLAFQSTLYVQKASSAGTLVYNDILSRCKGWDNKERQGDNLQVINTDPDITLELQAGDLVIAGLNPDAEKRAGIVLDCNYGQFSKEKDVFIKIGNPEILDISISQKVTLEKNQARQISYDIDYIFNEAILSYSVSGNKDIEVTIDKQNKKLVFQAFDKPATEQIEFSVKEPPPLNEEASKTITVTVLGDNQPPLLHCSPENEKITIKKEESVIFFSQSTDDYTPYSELNHIWYLDGERQNSQSIRQYEFLTNPNTKLGDYSIRLNVADSNSLSSAKTWKVKVISGIQNTTGNSQNDSQDYQQPGCNHNNIREAGEECDGTDDQSCLGYYCQDCICQIPREKECQPDWACTSWSGCISGKKIRQCSDANSCGENADKPAEEKSCSTTEEQYAKNSNTDPRKSNMLDDNGAKNSIDAVEEEKEGEEEKGLAANSQLEKKEKQDKAVKAERQSKKTGSDIKKSPERLNIVTVLVWILGILVIIPFLLIALFRLSAKKSQTAQQQAQQQPLQNYQHQKLSSIVAWYKSRGLSPNYAYNMLLRMGFNKQEAYGAVYQAYNNDSKR
ncbi:hypothetical protein GF323_01905 [Candidatus Woesearchaeota archaeon]|nr:hypothetical protein [Candidatus Woesearchaeota archaeon]